jgi:mannose-6-phosphate isomerase-like protein (cupin superfamily)
MKKKHLRFGRGFRVALANRRAQVAEMVLEPGKGEGDPRNRHRGADQWLFVFSGRGVAVINGRRHELRAGSLVLIEKGDRHEVRATGREPMRTLNFYCPPAYDARGEELPAGER